MKNKKKIIHIIIFFLIIIIVCLLSVTLTKMFYRINGDTDYQKIGLELNEYDIDYYTVYYEDIFGKYKVYKLNVFESEDKIRNRLENSNLWSKNKFNEYIMMRFYDMKGNESVELDREDLYYYNKKLVYAIYDIKNAKLYYLENNIYNEHKDYSDILGIKIKNYTEREIYDVRGGPQGDGTDYYVYKFTDEKGKEIIEKLENNPEWNKEKLDEDKLDGFKYNEEVLSIKNGYYHYKLVCRTSDKNKKENFTEEEATGYEMGVYDIDNNILYYYWTSY